MAFLSSLPLTMIGCDSFCSLGGAACEPGIYLTTKRTVPDTTLRIGTELHLDLREFYELGKGRSGGKFSGYPTIIPTTDDTVTVAAAYNTHLDPHGEAFRLRAKSPGASIVHLDISWNGGGATGETAHASRHFTMQVIP